MLSSAVLTRTTTLTRLGALAAALALGAPLGAQGGKPSGAPAPAGPLGNSIVTTEAVSEHVLRVCGDPDNLPFSNDRQEGFENRIAELIARDLGDSVHYLWWPHRRGFVRSTLRAGECDMLIGVPLGFDPVATTKPYYRSTYYIVTRADQSPRVTSLDDPALRKLRVGVNIIGYDYTNTPPAHALGARGIQVKGYSTFYGEGAGSEPQDIIDAVAKKDIDVAVVWGPLAGYFAKRSSVPLTLVALPDSDDASATGYPFAYDIAIGVRRSDKLLRAQIDSVLVRRRDDIARILSEFGIPTVAKK
jgi:quinoprotein dehydrogenase-associated probable ABC transporter substrate-binding protein